MNLRELLSEFGLNGALLEVLEAVLVKMAEDGLLAYERLAELARSAAGGGVDIQELLEDLILTGQNLHLFFQGRSTDGTLEWSSAYCLPNPGEVYIMPPVIRRLILDASRGGLDWRASVEGCLRELGERDAHSISLLVEELVRGAHGGLLTGAEIRDACLRLGIPRERVSPLIAELKGAGIISPRVSGAILSGKARDSPVYILNKTLARVAKLANSE